jgi:hypothetical protein
VTGSEPGKGEMAPKGDRVQTGTALLVRLQAGPAPTDADGTAIDGFLLRDVAGYSTERCRELYEDGAV